MNFINENLQILATLGSALAVYIALRIAATKDAKELKSEIKEMKQDLKSIDSRISRIEGHLTGMGHFWEPRIFEKKEE